MSTEQVVRNSLSQEPERQDAALQIKDMAPRLKVKMKNGHAQLDPDLANKPLGYALISKALGTNNSDFLFGVLDQLALLASDGTNVSEGKLNFALSVIKGIEPRDQVEAMLAAQMAAVHMATMQAATCLTTSQTTIQADSAGRVFGKLAQTFVNQMDGLKRYRTGAEQKLSLQNGTVPADAQTSVDNAQPSSRNTEPAPVVPSDNKIVPMPKERIARAPHRRRKCS